MMYIGCDKETIRSYCGYSGHIRQGKYGDNRVVGLARKGYLELLGFVHKIGHGRWMIHAQITLSEAVNPPPAYKESCSVESKEKISLSACDGDNVDKQPNPLAGREFNRQREEEASEKERNFAPKIYENELRVFNAVPCAEPDRPKTNLRRASKNG